MEIWVDAFGYEGFYKVSNYGQVISLARVDACGKNRKERKLILGTTKDGYKVVNFWKAKKAFHIGVHRIIWESFNKKKIPDNHEVNHINGIRDDNRPENLETMTHLDNIKYSKEVLKANYVSYGNRKLTHSQVDEIRNLRQHGMTLRAIANKYGVSRPSIGNIIKGKTWSCH